jgi:uncharacterized protein (TIGR02284 family)
MADPELSDAARLLEQLRATCRDGEDGFRQIAGELVDPALRERFIRYAQQRAGLASELLAEIQRLGGDPATTGHVSGAIQRGWMRLKAALTGADDAAILSEAERGEDVTVGLYRKALERDLPVDTRAVLLRQLDDIESVHREVRDLRDAALSATEKGAGDA